MIAETELSQNLPARICDNCSCLVELAAKFCGECGNGSTKAFEQEMPELAGYAHQVHLLARGQAAPQAQPTREMPLSHIEHYQQTPSFAPLPASQTADIPFDLKDEMSVLLVSLLRERFYLLMHCLVFLISNAIGFWLAIKAYNEYNADEGTKTVVALTPLMFINLTALTCIVPIKGTRREIAKIKDKLQYLHLRIDYRHLR